MELEPAAIEAILARWPVARLVTLGRGGKPEPVPIVFAHVAGALFSPLDGKPKRGGELARVRNLARDARAAVMLDHYEDDWSTLWWLRVEGRGEVLPADAHAEAVAALRAKYPQYERVALFAGEPRLIRIAIERITSWAASSGGRP
jgi:PPOX class probable F420-dependent enzyme